MVYDYNGIKLKSVTETTEKQYNTWILNNTHPNNPQVKEKVSKGNF